MHEPQFPILLLLCDCGEVQVYDRLEDLQDGLEPMDVQNREYDGWDFAGFPLHFSVTLHPSRSPWLCVELASGVATLQECMNAVQRYAEIIACPIRAVPGEQPIDYARRVEHWEDTRKWSNRPLWRRLLRLANPRPERLRGR